MRTWPVWLAAPLTALTIALYGAASGQVYVEWFVVRISEGSLALAVATFFRVLAVALPSVVLFVTVDPTDLADGLAQVWHLPARFVLGALAGLRMVGLFLEDWRALELARRARGIADQGRIRRFAGMAFALLVLSIRAVPSSPPRWRPAASALPAAAPGPASPASAGGVDARGGGRRDLGALRVGRGRCGHVELHPRPALSGSSTMRRASASSTTSSVISPAASAPRSASIFDRLDTAHRRRGMRRMTSKKARSSGR
jgi:hypothetical protein